MSLIKQLIPSSVKFNPASADVNWERIETLVHGPGAGATTNADDTNSAVFACLMAIATAYTEPNLCVYRKMSGKEEKLPENPLQGLIDRPTPNGELSFDEILFWTAWAKNLDGNAYWIKVRSGNAETGNVVEIWPVSPTLISPITERDRRGEPLDDWISYYSYQFAPNQFKRIPVQNVIHFRLGIDDQDMRKGLSPLKSLVRQISTDEEADRFVDTLLKNYAVPGLVVVPSGATSITEDQADRIQAKLGRKFGNDNRGNVAVMSKESTIQQFGFSPKDLDMSILHRIPEERISAVMGVPAIVAGLGAGLDRATYDNARSMGEWFTERKLIPQWRADARKINTSLKPDFISQSRVYVAFDLTDVRALQEDEDAKYLRLEKAVGKAWMTRNEARSDIGLDTIDGWDEEDIAPKPDPQPVPEELQEDEEEAQPNINGRQNGNGREQRAVDLEKWQKKAEKRLKESGNAACEFISEHIPGNIKRQIAIRLIGAKTPEEVKAAFDVAVIQIGESLFALSRDQEGDILAGV